MLGIIDTHHHIYPPQYVGENLQRILGRSKSLAARGYTDWTPAQAIERMDQIGIATAIGSITSPGMWFEDGEASRLRCRLCNEFGAKLAGDYPGRFGMFAAVPLPETEASLREIEYATEALNLDGIGLMTSYAGKLLGDPSFAEVMDELHRRRLTVFVHPIMSCGNVTPGLVPATIEFPTDTARAIANLIFSGTFARCRDITFIFSHGGGTLPLLVERLAGAFKRLPKDEQQAKLPHGLDYEIQRHYYDLASVAKSAPGMAAVLSLYPKSQLLFGSDEPFNSGEEVLVALHECRSLTSDLDAVFRRNAQLLFPRCG